MLREIRSEAELEAALQAESAVIYKHSPICGGSRRARDEMLEFAAAHPEIPVFQIDVVNQRPLSRRAAERLNVPHKSPQVILLAAGRPLWNDSHSAVRKASLERAIAQTRGATDAPPSAADR